MMTNIEKLKALPITGERSDYLLATISKRS